MELTEKLLTELQRRLKIGNRRGVHLNAIPANSRYKFDFKRLSHIDRNLPDDFITKLLTELPLRFRISWKDNVPDLNSLFVDDQTQLVKITKAFENLINQTEVIESEKGINTFGFGFPILARRDRADNKLTVAPILIWSLRIKRTKEFNTWEILRNEDDPIYINEVLINNLQSDANIEIEQIPSEMLDDGLIDKHELIEICTKLIRAINTTSPDDLEETFRKKLDKISYIGDKAYYDKITLNSSNSFIDFGGLFSIFEVQKQNIIDDYSNLLELEGFNIDIEDMKGYSFQPISSVETDPSQQSILHSLETKRNILIQGPPGTGKSQTLTAILINALENNKKTIVVCEKRTALEVLYNALIEKGLSNNCVLVRDIVKDRKTVVDSVRDRVDNSEYKKYRHYYSKESLNNLILKAKKLIASINKKHQKIDNKLIGNKSWSDVVGDWLLESKGNIDDYNLNIEKNLFDYSTQELNTLLDLIQKGQDLYSDFLPIKSTSFINPLKLVRDNPYIIEQNINDDFDFYSDQLDQIKLLLESNKSEFTLLRKSELKFQITTINNCIEKLIIKESELSGLLLSTKEDFCSFRNNEFCQQLESLSKIIHQIDFVFSENKSNPNLLNQKKVCGFGFKILAVFSKSKKKTITDHLLLQTNFSKLQHIIDVSTDFSTINFNGALEAKRNSLDIFKKEILLVKNGFNIKIDNEFDSFNLTSILYSNDSNNAIQLIQSYVDNSRISTDFKTKLLSIQAIFKNYLSEINLLFGQINKALIQSKDVNMIYSFNNSYQENKIILSGIKEELELIMKSSN